MDALDVLLVAARRWYVFLSVVLLSVFAGLGLAQERQPTYAATGDFAVIYRHPAELKPNQADPRLANPLTQDNLLKTAIVADLRSAQSQAELAAPGVLGTDPSTAPDGSRFTLVTDRASVTVTVRAYGPDRADVLRTVRAVLTASSQRAAALQDRVGAPEAGRLTTFITLPAQVVTIPPASAMKLLIGVIGVGVVTGAALSLLVDRLMTRRRLRRAAVEAAPPGDEPARDPLSGADAPAPTGMSRQAGGPERNGTHSPADGPAPVSTRSSAPAV